MNIKSLSGGLSFLGRVKGIRQTYSVFEGRDMYFVFSFSRSKPKAGYFNAVLSDAVPYARRLTGGKKGVTAQFLNQRARNRKLVGSSLQALNILYVLVAMGIAKIDRRRKTKQLFFNVRK
jgi:hypothetical protein